MKEITALFLAILICISFCACGESAETTKKTASEAIQENTSDKRENNKTENESQQYMQEVNAVVGTWVQKDTNASEEEASTITFNNDNTCEYEGKVYTWEQTGRVFPEYQLSVDDNVEYIFMENTTGEYYNLFTVRLQESMGTLTTDKIIQSYVKADDIEE